MYHIQIWATSPKGKELVCSKIVQKWGRGPPKKPYFFLPTQPLFWQGWENRVFIYGAVCCGFSTITEWQCLDWEACWRFMEGDMRGPALLSLSQIWRIDSNTTHSYRNMTYLNTVNKHMRVKDKQINCTVMRWPLWKNVTMKMYFMQLKVWTEFFQVEPNLRSPKPLHCNEAQFQCLEGGQ